MGVSAVLLRVVVEAVERAGVPRGALLEAAGIDASRLAEVHERFELREFDELQTRALELTGDEALGLHIAEQATEASFDLVAHLVAHSPTLREGLGLCTQFERLLMDEARLVLREKGNVATLEYEFVRSAERSDRMHVEFVLAALLRLVRTFVGPPGVARAVSFEHARPPYHREYTRIFGGVERFGQRRNALEFDRALLDRPQMHQHPALYSMLRAEAERALERVTEGARPADELKRYLLARPPARIPDIATAARDLGISERSLRRRLAADDTSYRTLVRATLEASAGHMLRDPTRSIQETARALGFSDAGAFHRAFKRWTGMTPKQYRERGAGGRSDSSVPGA
ncbi:MAG TPA: AraC family transcriptional regulator [Polyangiaceae bacterium]